MTVMYINKIKLLNHFYPTLLQNTVASFLDTLYNSNLLAPDILHKNNNDMLKAGGWGGVTMKVFKYDNYMLLITSSFQTRTPSVIATN